MQFRIATTVKCNRSKWVLSSIVHNWSTPLWVRSSSSTHRTADPAVHSGDPEGIDADEAAKSEAAQQEQEQKQIPTKESPVLEGNQTIKPATPTSKIESSGVNPPLDPFNQQKRHYNSATPPPPPTPPTILEDFSCVGMDGTPLPSDEKQSQDDNKEYYKDRKPSPLSEIEVADTRKPITRATDSGASSGYFGDPEVVGWREEQLDTAEEALRRATLIWKQNAMRDDPDSPQAKALRRALIEQRAKLGLSEFDRTV